MKKLEHKVPNLRFKGFTNDWEQHKLGDVVNLIGGGPFKSTDSVSKGIPWLKIANVGVNGITWNTESYLPEYFWNDYPQYQLKKGNYVVALTRPILNHRLKISKLDRDALLNQRVAKLTTSENLQYIVHLLERKKVVLQIENNLSGSDPPNLSSKDLYRIKIKIPSESNEQKQIGTFLTKLDSIISLQQRKLELLKEIKKGLLQKMFADKSKFPILRFEGFHDEWEQRKLGELYSYHNGKAHEQNQRSSGKYELINLNSISVDGTLKSSGRYINHADEILRQNDLVMILSDIAHGTLLGRVAIIPQDNKYVLNQRVALLRPISKSENSNFMAPLINNNQRYFHKMGIGTSQLNISKSTVIESLWQIPKIKEQSVIGNFLQNIDHIISLQHQKLAKYQSIKKSLLQQMFM